MRCEPVGERLYLGNFVCLSTKVAFNPAFHLAFEKALGMAKCMEASILQVDGVNLYQRLNHCLGKLLAEIRGGRYTWGEGGIYNDPFAALHHVEWYSYNSEIITEDVRLRCE